jgi:hypothetical protein
VDYSLFMAVMKVLTLERVEKRPGVTPATFPPPVFAKTAYVSVFRVSLPPHFAIVEGGLYIKNKTVCTVVPTHPSFNF